MEAGEIGTLRGRFEREVYGAEGPPRSQPAPLRKGGDDEGSWITLEE